MSDHIPQPLAEETAVSEDEHSDAAADLTQPGEKKKKKKSKKSKGKKAAVVAEDPNLASSEPSSASKISAGMVQHILKANPSLAAEAQGADPKKIQEMLGRLTLEEILTGMVRSCSSWLSVVVYADILGIQAPGGKNRKDMASYKFWATQPVTRFGILLLNIYRDRPQELTANQSKMSLKPNDQMV